MRDEPAYYIDGEHNRVHLYVIHYEAHTSDGIVNLRNLRRFQRAFASSIRWEVGGMIDSPRGRNLPITCLIPLRPTVQP